MNDKAVNHTLDILIKISIHWPYRWATSKLGQNGGVFSVVLFVGRALFHLFLVFYSSVSPFSLLGTKLVMPINRGGCIWKPRNLSR